MRLSELQAGDVMVGAMTRSVFLVAQKDDAAELWFNLVTGELYDVKDDDGYGSTGNVASSFSVYRDGVEIVRSR